MKLTPLPTSVLISLSTYPNFQTDNYIDSVISSYEKIKDWRKEVFCESKDKYDTYFTPLVYNMWGNWDLCVIQQTDNSEIITKVLQPDHHNSYISEGQNSTKVYSGISFKNIGNDLSEINKLSTQADSLPFIGIVNLKYASKWLLPNAEIIPYKFLKYAHDNLKDFTFFPINTFNTYEVSIVILGNKLNEIVSKVFHLREIKVSDLPLEDYTLKKMGHNTLSESESHLFVDSQSYFGARIVNDKKNSPDPDCASNWKLSNNVRFEDIKAVFEVEAKPGHAKDLEVLLGSIVKIESIDKKMHFQAGIYDFFISWDYNSIAFKNLFESLRKKNSELKHHIKKLNTRLLFDYPVNDEKFDKPEQHEVGKFFDISKIDRALKTIKVSSSLRNQIVKLFTTYQNSIRDAVTYSAFIDLFFFVKRIENKIFSFEDDVTSFFDNSIKSKRNHTVEYIENQLSFMVNNYKDSYYLRYVNERIKDVQDFLIPHNTQLQTLIGFYDSFVKCILSELIDESFGNSFIINFDEQVTNVSRISIRLLSSNLFEPGLIYTALSKEIITVCSIHKLPGNKGGLNKQISKTVNDFFNDNPDNKVVQYRDLISEYDYHYAVVDYLRYKYFFKEDFELFLYYHLGFILQYPKQYDSTGNINSNQLFIEIQRLVILNHLIAKIDSKFNPDILFTFRITPEIRSLWFKYLDVINTFINEIDSKVNPGESIIELLEETVAYHEVSIRFKNLKNEFPNKYISTFHTYISDMHKVGKFPLSLQRDWKTGKINLDQVKAINGCNKPYYLFDSQGGGYFINYDKLMTFSTKRNEVFETLRRMSFKYTGELYEKLLTHKIH
jgi:hypothetical protein